MCECVCLCVYGKVSGFSTFFFCTLRLSCVRSYVYIKQKCSVLWSATKKQTNKQCIHLIGFGNFWFDLIEWNLEEKVVCDLFYFNLIKIFFFIGLNGGGQHQFKTYNNSHLVFAADDVAALQPINVFLLEVDLLNLRFLHEDHRPTQVEIPYRSVRACILFELMVLVVIIVVVFVICVFVVV